MWSSPYDSWSLATLVVVGAALLISSRKRSSPAARLALVLLAATLLRVDASTQWSLHAWDERFHALVAKRLLDTPLSPTLYPFGHIDADSSNWQTAQVWLHKPPLAMWLIAASYSFLGINELALRLPGIIIGVASVWVTYRIGLELFGVRAALLAAAFHALNGFLVSLVAGRRVADHVDTLLIFLIEVGAYLVLTQSRRSPAVTSLLVGLFTGLALLTKSLPGLLPLALHTLEGQGGPWWSYAADAPRFFGEAAPLAFLWLIWRLSSRASDYRLGILAAWIVVPYAVFSAAATKLPNLVMISAPAFFLISGASWIWLRDLATTRRWRPLAQLALCALLALPARYLLEPTGPLERRERSPHFAEVLRAMDSLIAGQHAAIFNVPDPVTAMFYSRFPCYGRLPTPYEFESLKAAGVAVAIYSTPTDRSMLSTFPGAIAILADH